MNKDIIATIRLAQGEGGYYDELSRIHLTVGNPQRDVYAGTNCTQIRRSVKSGRLRLLFGSLGEEKKIDLDKKGNRFTASEAPVAPVVAPVAAPVVEPEAPVAEEAPAFVEESGATEIEAVKPAEEAPTEEVVEEAAAEEVVPAAEEAETPAEVVKEVVEETPAEEVAEEVVEEVAPAVEEAEAAAPAKKSRAKKV